MNKLIKPILLFLGLIRSKLRTRKHSEEILLIKLDAIGDIFILMSVLRHFETSSNITIVCSEGLSEVGEYHFPKIKWIECNKKKMEDDSVYRKKFIEKNIRGKPFASVINMVGSRDWLSDYLVALSHSSHKIGYFGDTAKQNRLMKFLGGLAYSDLIPNIKGSEYRILHTLLNKSLVKKDIGQSRIESSDYIVLFPGASWFGKAWEPDKFSNVARRLVDSTGYKVLVCGGPDDKHLSAYFKDVDQNKIEDKIGETNLLELCELISKARAILTNDTSAAHIAEYYNVPGVAIMGGGHWGRFLPYNFNEVRKDSIVVMTNEMDCFGCHWKCLFDHGISAVPCVSEVGVDEVFDRLNLVIS